MAFPFFFFASCFSALIYLLIDPYLLFHPKGKGRKKDFQKLLYLPQPYANLYV